MATVINTVTARGQLNWQQARHLRFAVEARNRIAYLPAAIAAAAIHAFAAWWLLTGATAGDIVTMSNPGAGARGLAAAAIAALSLAAAVAVMVTAHRTAQRGRGPHPDLAELARIALAEIERRRQWNSDLPGSDPLSNSPRLRDKLSMSQGRGPHLVRPRVDELFDERIEQLGPPPRAGLHRAHTSRVTRHPP